MKSAEFVLPKVEVIKSPEELVELQTENGLKAEITDLTTVEKLEKILRPLGCSLNEFFNSNSSEMNLSDDELILIMNFRRISKEKAAVLLQISNIL